MNGRSSAAGVTVVVVLAVVAPGCKLARAKAPPVAAAPRPRGGPGGAPVTTSEPLSLPQTTVRLPPPQPIPPEAVPPEPQAPVGEPTLPPPRPKAAERARPAPAAVPAPAREGAGSSPQLRPQLSAEQERDLWRQIDQNLAAAERALTQARIERSDKERYAAAERVRAFIEQAQQARRLGDLVRAKSLAERAQLLASDLAQASR